MKKLFLLFLLSILNLGVFAQDYQDDCNDSLAIPETLAPNGDGMNDTFLIGFNCPPETFMMSIYNRWGQEVFKTENYQTGWDGNDDKGQAVAEGTYIWTIRYTFNGGATKKTGNVTILR